MRFTVALVLLACLGAVPASAPAAVPYRITPDIRYAGPPSDPVRNRLDVYTPRHDRDGGSPVIVWVHGGGWYQGSRTSAVLEKAERFTRSGYVFVSAGYRLSPRVTDPDSLVSGRVMFPDQPRDVAEAVGWVSRNIRRFGGDPAELVLMGHSAGGQIVSLLATDQRFLARAGVSKSQVRGVISLDTVGFDIAALTDPASPFRSEESKPAYWNAFGTPDENATLDRWKRASPLEYAGPNDPPFLFVVPRSVALRQRESRMMARRLEQRVGHAILPVAKTHREINREFGTAADQSGETARAIAFAHAVTTGERTVRAVAGARTRSFAISRKARSRPVVLAAGSRPVGARLRCRLDLGPAHDCRGRNLYRVGPGAHVLRVRAYDFTGRLGPAERLRFTVSRRPGP
ncbi:MAG TPA: carboxylesterase family protein [Solirubrobacterales bacterium]|nr:carboxylesterase family protein [Solirubrobacterales bacterium]